MVPANKPDLVVGIDFGTTCTGVAYQNLHSGVKEVRYLQRWPGKASANENKVKTLLAYRDVRSSPIAWGFAAERSDSSRHNNVQTKDYFKLFLDPKELHRVMQKAPAQAPASMEEVEKMYTDFLTCLYNHISTTLSVQEFPERPWARVTVDFIFSVPTTWTSQSVVERFRRITQAAGFGSVSAHSVSVGLTEAEAAAVHVSKGQPNLFRAGDILLMCDAGGGTTDLSVLQVSSNIADILDLHQVDFVHGKSIGSVAIDDDFSSLVRERLGAANSERPLGLSEADISQQAWDAANSADYQNTKCEFGNASTQNLEVFNVPLRRIPFTYHNDRQGIRAQEITISFKDLQAIFDKQVNKLFRHIDSQLQRVSSHKIKYLILSGGLGHSAYVQQQLKNRYEVGSFAGYPIMVRVSLDPQLAVCMGLVKDRIQRLDTGHSALSRRICRESYGVQCDIPATPQSRTIYGAATTFTDARDEKVYYKQCVRWLIKQGEPVLADEALSWDFLRLFAPNAKDKPYDVKLLKSSAPAESIPHVASPGADLQEVCRIKTSFAAVSLKECEEKNKSRFGMKKKAEHHFVVKFQIRAVIGPADLKFELWLNGRKISADHAIVVEWLDGV